MKGETSDLNLANAEAAVIARSFVLYLGSGVWLIHVSVRQVL